MSKAILVLPEMPESCEECPCCRRDTFEQLGCSTQSHVINIILRMVEQKKPRWCPLRPMPEKQQECLEGDEWSEGAMRGWNDCLSAIEGNGE